MDGVTPLFGKLVGRQQETRVGPMSGRSNVVFWLESRGLPAPTRSSTASLRGQSVQRTLTHDQVQNIAGGDAKLKRAGAKLLTARRKVSDGPAKFSDLPRLG